MINQRKLHAVLISAIAFVSLSVYPSFAGSVDIEKLINDGKLRKAESAIKKRLKKRSTEKSEILHLKVTLAKVLRLQKKDAKGLRILNELDFAERSKPMVRLEMARHFNATKDLNKALEYYELCREERDVVIRCNAHFETAVIYFNRKKYEECIERCEKTINEGSNYTGTELAEVIEKARKLLEEAKNKLIIAKFGMDYYYYRQARYAQSKGQYKAAIDSYQKIKFGGLKDAAGCYIPACLQALGETKDAVKQYKSFISNHPFDLYRGEAMLDFAKIKYLKNRGRSDLTSIRKLLERAVDWNEKAPQHDKEHEDIKLINRYFSAPEQFMRRNNFGALVRNYASPETIVNRITCPWYLAQQKIQTLLLYGFVCFELGDKKLAEETFNRVQAFNDQEGGNYLSGSGVHHRLLKGLENGGFLVPSFYWKKMQGSNNSTLKLGCFYYVAGETDLAQSLFNSINKKGRRVPKR